MVSDKEAKELVIQITNELFVTGHLTATGGNISAVAAEEGTIWVTPSRMYKGGITAADLVRIREDGSVVDGDRTPTVEWQMHYASYRARPGTTGAVHTHSPVATAFGITNQTFPPINTDAVFLRDTVTVPWLMPGSKDLADAVGGALTKSRGCILQNHGLMAVGKSLRDAANRAMMIEETAKIVLYCKQFGGAVTLLPDEWVEQLARLADFI
ncbi:MAG: class II aldolase/adducin family protein [Candidatus Binatia bacterium]